MKLYGYWRSSAAYRVRIGLALKRIPCEHESVNLRPGIARPPGYVDGVNPQGYVPALVLDDGTIVTQSMAILEYLEETVPQPPLLPADPAGRARVRALANVVACDIHPVAIPAVTGMLREFYGVDEAGRMRWYRYHVERGLRALEALVTGHPATGAFCHGERPTLADICLVPQLYNARRFACDLSGCPTLVAIDARCAQDPAFAAALPERQHDAG